MAIRYIGHALRGRGRSLDGENGAAAQYASGPIDEERHLRLVLLGAARHRAYRAVARGDGYAVFRDRSALPPCESFDARRRAAIEDSDVFIFLISPESVSPGCYTLTELKLATWRHTTGAFANRRSGTTSTDHFTISTAGYSGPAWRRTGFGQLGDGVGPPMSWPRSSLCPGSSSSEPIRPLPSYGPNESGTYVLTPTRKNSNFLNSAIRVVGFSALGE
jgi:hypothetical protein